MIMLVESLQAWGSADFRKNFKHELENIEAEKLPLQQGLSQSSHVSNSGFSVMIISDREQFEYIFVKAGIFYSGIIAGCSCADDPTPVDEISEYCEVEVKIDKVSAEATISLVTE